MTQDRLGPGYGGHFQSLYMLTLRHDATHTDGHCGFRAFTRADKGGCAYTFMECVGVLFKVGWLNEIRMFRSYSSRPYVHEYL